MKSNNSFFKACIIALVLFASAQTGFSQLISFVNNATPGDYTAATGKNVLNCTYSLGVYFAGTEGTSCVHNAIGGISPTNWIKIKKYPLGSRAKAKLEAVVWAGSSTTIGVFIGCDPVDNTGGTEIGRATFGNADGLNSWCIESIQEVFFNITAQAATQDIWIRQIGAGPTPYLYSFEMIGVVVETDIIPPTAPTGVTAVASPTGTGATVSWTGLSTDNKAMGGYKIFNGAVQIGETTSATQKSIMLFGLTANTSYTLTVKGFDTSANLSPASNAVTITTGAELDNLAFGMVGTATNEQIITGDLGKYSGSKTTDGSSTTNWMTSSGNSPVTADLDINLGTAQLVKRVEIDFQVPSPLGSTNYTILTSTDGVTYTPAVATPAAPATNTQNDFASVSAKYIRIHMAGIDPLAGIGIYEVRVYGAVGTALKSVASNTKMSIYPNPVVNNTFSINYENFDAKNVNVSILDVLGKEVYSTKLENTSTVINTKGLKGLYIVRATNGSKTVSSKVVFE